MAAIHLFLNQYYAIMALYNMFKKNYTSFFNDEQMVKNWYNITFVVNHLRDLCPHNLSVKMSSIERESERKQEMEY